MSYDEPLVGSLALVLAVVALVIAVGPWSPPYQLESISAIQRRFGKTAARGAWFAVALAALACGWAILNGLRPGYATHPTDHAQHNR